MNSPRPLFLLPWVAVVFLSAPACISVPDIEPAKAEVRIASPDGTAYTNGVLEVRLEVTGHRPERVELLQDGEVLAELEPPYTYAWDTAGVAEGTHRLEARAVFGDVVFPSEAREVVVDRTPPQVVSRTPEPGAQDVWVKRPIQAVFSEPVKASTLTSESVRLTVGTVEVARTVSLSADGRTLTVEPVTAITAPITASLSLSDALTDLAGNKVPVSPAGWSWTLPQFVPYPLLSSKLDEPRYEATPYVRLDESGNPLVMLREFDGTSVNLFVSRWTGTQWEQLGNGLKTSPISFEIGSQSIQVSPDGEPIVAWQEGVGTEFDNHIYVARWTGNAWTRLGDEQGLLPDRPHALGISLQLTTTGQPVVAFNMDPEDAAGGSVHVYRWSGDTWKPIGSPVYGASSSRATIPTLALDANDNPVVVFTQADLTSIYAWRWDNDNWQSLGSTVNTYDTLHSVETISLVLDRDGQPTVFWESEDSSGGKPRVLANTWSNGQWTPLGTPLSASETSSARAPIAGLDSNRDLLVAWFDFQDLATAIHLRRWTGSSWEQVWSTLDAVNGTGASASIPSMDADPQGNVVLAWSELRAGKREVVVYRRNH